MRVQVRNEVKLSDLNGKPSKSGWDLCFQLCRYIGDEDIQEGYRFIWRRPDGSLQAARGQARLPSIETASRLTQAAITAGWGNHSF